ncbi:flippase-like domain-containing protein [Vreelandella nanhaiensis]|uniref:Flippase-like domain-containing protein n=1 Tax=Vreelandella nanhaiensis TaxID=1258546 RepID=A0A433KXG2_9GAMM|nr:flippase-like domain-containing protein [Halomonas nanhaiensis]
MAIKSALRSPWIKRALISAGLLGAVALFVEPREVVAQVERLSAGWVALGLIVSVFQIMLSAWRWQFTAGRVGTPLRFNYAWREYYLALLVNQLLPGGILGDAGRAHRHARQAGSRGSAWRAVIIERTSGQVAIVLLTLVALLLSPLWHAVLGWQISLMLVGGLGLLAVALWQGLSRLPSRKLPAWWHAMAVDIKRAIFSPGVWHLQLGSSLAIVMSYGLVMVCAARAIGVEIAALQLLALTPVLLLAMLVPLSVAGWGLREGAAAGTWVLVGLPTAQGVAISLAYGVLVLLSSLPGIWVALERRHRAPPSGERGGAQQHVEQRVITTSESAHGRAQRTFKRFDGCHLQAGPARTNQQWGNHQMQAVYSARFNELRHCHAAPFHQDALQTVLVKQGNHITWDELPFGIERQHTAFHRGASRRSLCLWPHYVQGGRQIGMKQFDALRHTATWVQHHPCRVRAGDMAHRQLRVIGTGRSCSDDYRIRQGTKPVQVHQALMAIDIVRVAAFCGDTPIQTLPELGNYPGRVTGQRRQARQQFSRLRHQGIVINGAGGLAMADGLKPLPCGFYIRQCFLISTTIMTREGGHNVSVLRKPFYLAGQYGPAQAYSICCTGQLGGLHVSH